MLKRVLQVILVLVLLLGGYVFAMRFADGPSGIVAGGAFTSGELVQGEESDWSFLTDRQEVEFQLLDPPRSRTTWIVQHDNRIFIPCGYMNSTWGKLWKQWPLEAEVKGDAILRVDGRLYERTLKRIRTGPELPVILSELGRKYLNPAELAEAPGEAAADPEALLQAGLQQIADGGLWIFEMAPRE